jgi:succinyl-diaminopimelate desuccinylase
MKTQLSALLNRLITFKTISGKENQDEVNRLYDWVTNQLSKSDCEFKKVKYNGYVNLIISEKKPKEKKCITLLAHIDVVPAEADLFKPTTDNGLIIGRGASDMKFAVACYIKLLKDTRKLKNVTLKIILTSDEEIGGLNGTLSLVNDGYLDDAKVIFLPDGGDDFNIITYQKGIIHIRLTTKGVSTHASKPFLGVNAIETILKDYRKIKKEVKHNNRNGWNNTISLTKIVAGEAVNTIPDEASAWIDIRFIEGFSVKKIINSLKNAISPSTKLDLLVSGELVSVNTDNYFVKMLKKLAQEAKDGKVIYAKDFGTSDARHLTKLKVPVLIIKPKAGSHHSTDEWIDLDSLEKYYHMLKKYIYSIDNYFIK